MSHTHTRIYEHVFAYSEVIYFHYDSIHLPKYSLVFFFLLPWLPSLSVFLVLESSLFPEPMVLPLQTHSRSRL